MRVKNYYSLKSFSIHHELHYLLYQKLSAHYMVKILTICASRWSSLRNIIFIRLWILPTFKISKICLKFIGRSISLTDDPQHKRHTGDNLYQLLRMRSFCCFLTNRFAGNQLLKRVQWFKLPIPRFSHNIRGTLADRRLTLVISALIPCGSWSFAEYVPESSLFLFYPPDHWPQRLQLPVCWIDLAGLLFLSANLLTTDERIQNSVLLHSSPLNVHNILTLFLVVWRDS